MTLVLVIWWLCHAEWINACVKLVEWCFLLLNLNEQSKTWQHYVFQIPYSALEHNSSFWTEIMVTTCQCVLFPCPFSLNVTYENTLHSIFLFNQKKLHLKPNVNVPWSLITSANQVFLLARSIEQFFCFQTPNGFPNRRHFMAIRHCDCLELFLE